MTIIQLNRFGGMAPSANQAFTDANVATVARNVDLRFKDMRPFKVPAVVSTVSAGTSLYKLNGSSTFITNANDVNYVRGQISGDATERTYYTGDGAPKVTDLTLAVRQLGVPKPSTAPVVVVTKNPSFTTDDAENAKFYAPSYIFTAVKTSAIQGIYSGLLDADLADLTASPRPWEYSVVRGGSLSGSVFTPSIATDRSLISSELEYVTDTTTVKVPLFVRARKYVADNTTLNSVLTNIPSPDVTTPSAKMMTATQVTAMAAGIQAHLVSRDAEVNDLLVKIKKEKTDFMSLLNNPGSVTNFQAGANASIYTTAPGSTQLAAALSEAAAAIVDAAQLNSGDTSLNTSSANATLQTYILTGAEGLKTVNSSGLTTWIFSKIKSAIALDKYDDISMRAEAREIALTFANAVESIAKNNAGSGAASASSQELTPTLTITKILIEKQALMESYVKRIEAIYQAVIDEGLQDAITELFVRNVASTFPTGTPAIVLSRAYVETYVTDRGEESEPSTVSNIVDLDQNDTCTVALGAVPSGRNITKRRLWRSSSGSSSSAFLFQGEYTAATTSVVDTKADSLLGESCPTFGWAEPPTSLKGLVAMPNGVMLGFVGNTVHACEPYAPYAWPAKYDIPLESPVVGIAVAGQTAVVTTTGSTYLISGADSMSLSTEKLPVNQACVAKKSMVAIGGTVIYASPDGLVVVEGGSVSVMTSPIISKEDWGKYRPQTIISAEYEGKYCAFCRTEGAGFPPKCLVFDLTAKTFTEIDVGADAVFSDKSTDSLYVLTGTQVKDFFPVTGTAMQALWQKEIHLPAYESFSWLAVEAKFNALETVEVVVTITASGLPFHTVTVKNNKPVRLPSGRHKLWNVSIASAIDVTCVTLASSSNELKKAAV